MSDQQHPSSCKSGGASTKDALDPLYAKRICRDINQLFSDPLPDIMVCPDPENFMIAHSIIIGPENTPYEGGFFYFYILFPNNYPFSPPDITLMTTAQNTVRFNPNLYENGKVCLSILNTWMGPQWTSGLSLSTVLLSIQSIMNEEPYYNEPGASTSDIRNSLFNPVKDYNDIIFHETIRVAVIRMIEGSLDTKDMPSVLKEFITDYFKTKVSYYDKVIENNLRLDGLPMKDPFNQPRGIFKYKELKVEMEKLKQKYCSESSSDR